ncbi:hypothetical protein H696_04338 [Fonticula alba]|uniref:Uncharacterized protein n=1 Tax=Fonticula alba TaxID=691883 RepID=A0A058Z4R7_FONAL|nr:hypothetical protein H696_04338 [Fonticula alba]KCV68918.1 hypothetical protein H696_04338 [Fonticula alba]|eukprot:XP_009496489.1 hypothetical protein H696_04338 [Fonticula alba]
MSDLSFKQANASRYRSSLHGRRRHDKKPSSGGKPSAAKGAAASPTASGPDNRTASLQEVFTALAEPDQPGLAAYDGVPNTYPQVLDRLKADTLLLEALRPGLVLRPDSSVDACLGLLDDISQRVHAEQAAPAPAPAKDSFTRVPPKLPPALLTAMGSLALHPALPPIEAPALAPQEAASSSAQDPSTLAVDSLCPSHIPDALPVCLLTPGCLTSADTPAATGPAPSPAAEPVNPTQVPATVSPASPAASSSQASPEEALALGRSIGAPVKPQDLDDLESMLDSMI